jgi:hypothetical protein
LGVALFEETPKSTTEGKIEEETNSKSQRQMKPMLIEKTYSGNYM